MDERTAPYKLPGFNSCIIGLSERPGEDQVVAYDFEKVLQVIMSAEKIDRSLAVTKLDKLVLEVSPKTMPMFLSFADSKQIDGIYK